MGGGLRGTEPVGFSARWGVMDVYRARQADTWPKFSFEGFFAGLSIGDSAFGGFFAGIIDTNQSGSIDAADDYQTPLRYALIVSPKSLESPGNDLRYASSGQQIPPGAATRWNGLAAQNAVAGPNFPAFNYCNGLSFPDDGGSKWYLPALDELELCYRNFKPTTENNATGTRGGGNSFPPVAWNIGANKASDPPGAAYTTTVPGQTSITSFRANNAQAFITSLFEVFGYWTATAHGGELAWSIRFNNGSADPEGGFFFTQNYVRPVRRVLL